MASKSYCFDVSRALWDSLLHRGSSANNLRIALKYESELLTSLIMMPLTLFLTYSLMPREFETTGMQPAAIASNAVRPNPSDRDAST